MGEYEDPGANTEMFRIYVESGDPETPGRSRAAPVAAAAIVLVAAVIVLALVAL
jgi:hypothetical protein